MAAGKRRHMHTHEGMVIQRSASRQPGPIPLNGLPSIPTLPLVVDLHRTQPSGSIPGPTARRRRVTLAMTEQTRHSRSPETMTLCHVGGRHGYATARNRRPEGRCAYESHGTGRKLIGRVQVLTFMTAKDTRPSVVNPE